MSTQPQNNDTKKDQDQEQPDDPFNDPLVNEFFSLGPPNVCKENLTDQNIEALEEFRKLQCNNDKYEYDKKLYKHSTEGYMYTVDERPCDGLLEWYTLDGSLVHRSSMNFWVKPTRELVDDEKKWLSCVELIGRE